MALDEPDFDTDALVHFNGINADGGYLFDPMSTEELAARVLGRAGEGGSEERAHQAELKSRRDRHSDAHLGVKEGIDATLVEQAGWGVILPAVKVGSDEAREQQAILEALSPLLALRRQQATTVADRYREYCGELGYRPGESKQRYLARLGAGPGPADPDVVPYYLLIVGSPQMIPYSVQYQIDVQYAVGRLHFETVEEYANYARSVVLAETGGARRSREIAFVGVANPDDPATELSREHLVAPLADMAEGWPEAADWRVRRYFDEAAKKATITQVFGGSETPALVFTGSHGMGFRKGHPLQERHQGALLLQDWEGPSEWRGPIGEDLYFSGDDISSDADLSGLVAFNFACFGAGTPEFDDFSKQASKRRRRIADRAFVGGLHRKLLGHAKGGALATIGHVERAWDYSFVWGSRGSRRSSRTVQLAVFESTLRALMKGVPVGMALEYFNERYAEMASDLSQQIEEMEFAPDAYDPRSLVRMWTASNDARGYAVIGDPAVRLVFPQANSEEQEPVSIDLRGLDQAAEATGAEGASGRSEGLDADKPAAPEFVEPRSDLRPLHNLAKSLLDRLSRALDGDMSIEIRTYVSRQPGANAVAHSVPEQGGDLRACTRLGIDGSLDTVVPKGHSTVDAELWKLHLELVRQAQATRAETLRILLSTLSRMDLSSPDE